MSSLPFVSPALTQLTAEMAAQSLTTALEPIARPNFGSIGRKFPVYVNAFKVSPPKLIIYQYDVKILPETPVTPPRLNRQIWDHLDKTLNIFNGVAVAYDGRAMAYSPKKLPGDGQWTLNLPEDDGSTSVKGRVFTVEIRFTRPIDLERLHLFVNGGRPGDIPDASDVQSAIQACAFLATSSSFAKLTLLYFCTMEVNVLIQHGPSMLYPSRAASFFLPPLNTTAASISKGLVMWNGLYSSVRGGPSTLFLNLDIASQPFYQAGNLPAVVLNFLRSQARGITEADLAADRIPQRAYIELDRWLKSLKVTLNVKAADGIQPVRKIKNLERMGATDAHFVLEDGSRYNVASYFQMHYNVRLQHPEWPLVRVSKIAMWPLELCEVQAGQKFSRKLDPDQTADAIKLTTVGPADRLNRLRQGIAQIQPRNTSTTNAMTPLEQWQVQISTEPIEVVARELAPPTVKFQRSVQPREGVWDIRGNQFHKGTKIERWLILVFDSDKFFRVEEVQNSVMGLVSSCTQAGMTIVDQRPPIHYVPRGEDVATYIKQKGKAMAAAVGAPPQMLICFLPRKPCDEYAKIKKFGDVDLGVATQCLFINKAKKGNPQYYSNIALKMNVKMRGGINSVLDDESLGKIITEKPCMVFGADVTHPSPGSLAPSIAAVVGSMNRQITVYGTSIRVQSSRLEVIAHLAEMVYELILQFKTRWPEPKRLIFFRDGVSEGQFPEILASEVSAIKLACAKIGDHFKPALTYIVCGKRHHMSFFPKSPADADRKNGNVKAGTTIDTHVTSPFQFDWYTQSHASLLGTGRSAHYTVLVDDSNFGADVLQKLVFNLCFTYARCTRSVSYVTPAYYADRVCTRAQLLLKSDADDDASTHVSSHSGASEERIRVQQLGEYQGRLKAIHANLNDSLYFL